MSKPIVHAQSAAKKFGGTANDYLSIEEMIDSSKSSFGDNRHRAIFHSSFGAFVMQLMFGINYESIDELRNKYNLPEEFIKDYEKQREVDRRMGTQLSNSENKKFSVRDIAEMHCLEDFRMKFIPSIQDYLENMEIKPWMCNGIGLPSSAKKVSEEEKETIELSEPLTIKEEDKPTTSKFNFKNKVLDGMGARRISGIRNRTAD